MGCVNESIVISMQHVQERLLTHMYLESGSLGCGINACPKWHFKLSRLLMQAGW
jgi:hypothetical protein